MQRKKQQNEPQVSSTLTQRALQSCAMREMVSIPYKAKEAKLICQFERKLVSVYSENSTPPFSPITTSFHEIQFLCIHPSYI